MVEIKDYFNFSAFAVKMKRITNYQFKCNTMFSHLVILIISKLNVSENFNTKTDLTKRSLDTLQQRYKDKRLTSPIKICKIVALKSC